MTDHTPSTEDVIRAYSIPLTKMYSQRDDERFSEYLARISIEGHSQQIESEAAARRWLAAHDRDVAASAIEKAIADAPRAEIHVGPNDWREATTIAFLRHRADTIRTEGEKQ